MTSWHALSRRQFLRISLTASGALLVGMRSGVADAQALPLDLLGDDLTSLTAFVMIERDNRVVIGARGCESGQGVITSLPMMIAEELDVEWSQVRVQQLPYGYTEVDGQPSNRFGNQSLGTASSVREGWDDLRRAGAIARRLLLRAAADVWALPIDQLATDAGRVVAPQGSVLTYGALSRSAAGLAPDSVEPILKTADNYRIVGKPTRTVDARNLVSGRTRYAIDEFLTGALVAVVLRCPHLDGHLESVDDSATRKITGVRDVIAFDGPAADQDRDGVLAAGIAVLADNTWAALQGRDALKPVWSQGPWAEESSATLTASAHALLDAAVDGIAAREEGDLATSRKRARHQISARYELPFLAHATMEPPGALIELRENSVLLVAALQDPDGASRLIASMTGIARVSIEIRLPRSGGSFGRRLSNDYVAEAVTIAQRAQKPVKLVWTREDDLANDFYRPFGVHAMSATLDRANRVAGWMHHCAATPLNVRNSARRDDPAWRDCLEPDAFPAGLVANLDKRFHALVSGMPRGRWRSGGHAFHAFATESFIDEIAFEVRRDAVAMRLEMLGEPREIAYSGLGGPVFDTGRMAEVLRQCAERIQWNTRRGDGRGVGIACHFTDGGYAAHAFEISMQGENVRIHRAVCVVDVGRVINPLGLEGQVIGATIDGLSTALNLAITVKQGRVQQGNFTDYRLLPMRGTPERFDVHLIESSRDPVGGSEVAIASVAPALANAIFATTTVRIRKLPLMPELRRML